MVGGQIKEHRVDQFVISRERKGGLLRAPDIMRCQKRRQDTTAYEAIYRVLGRSGTGLGGKSVRYWAARPNGKRGPR